MNVHIVLAVLVVLFGTVFLIASSVRKRDSQIRRENHSRVLGDMQNRDKDETAAALATSERAPAAEALKFYEHLKNR